MAVKTEIVTITPQRAEKLLERNAGNRKIRPSAINRYATDMAAGNWILNGEAIAVSQDGVLLDGQNRLSACVMANRPFETVLVTGLNGRARETIDIGVPRSMTDALTWLGVDAPSTTAAALGYLFRYQGMLEQGTRQLVPGNKKTRAEVLHFLAENPEVSRSGVFADDHARRIPCGRGIVAATHYLICSHYTPQEADDFYTEVADVGLADQESPSYMLRQWLLDHQTMMTRKSTTVLWAYNIKAARFWLQGLTVKRLFWKRTSQQTGEEFPRIDLKLV